MEILKIKNYGPIKDATLDLKSFVVLIGQQSSGKSAIAKLISILRNLIFKKDNNAFENEHHNFDISQYLTEDTKIFYESANYSFTYEHLFGIISFKNEDKIRSIRDKIYLSKATYQESLLKIDHNEIKINELNTKNKNILMKLSGDETSLKDLTNIDRINLFQEVTNNLSEAESLMKTSQSLKVLVRDHIETQQKFIGFSKASLYIPSERNVFSLLSNSTFSLILNDIPLPSTIKMFGSTLERAQNRIHNFDIDFLGMSYIFDEDKIFIEDKKQKLKLPISQMSSGVQSLIPLMLILEHRDSLKLAQTFVIEEPEMNLFPETQYELIKYIITKCMGTKKQSNEVVITTHSPYCLSGINNLVMAGIVGSTKKKAKSVNEILPKSSWLNRDDYAAYYLESGTLIDIIDKETGLIDNNKLDSTSHTINNDFSQLFDLYTAE